MKEENQNEQNQEIEVVEKETTANMKKYYKSPEDLEAVVFNEYQMKRLKKIINGDLVQVPFLFKTDFKFAENFESPMLFLGSRNSFWKEAIKEYKVSKTYASGICTKKVNEDGSVILEMEVLSGKGKTPLNLKKINKMLLKKLKIKAEFVEANEKEEKGFLDKVKEFVLGSEDAPEGNVISVSSNIVSRIQVEFGLLKKIPQNDEKERNEKLKLIETLVAEWEKDYKKDKSSNEATYIKKVKTFLQKPPKELADREIQRKSLEQIIIDFKDYKADRTEYVENYKTAIRQGLDFGDIGLGFPETVFKSFYKELQIQLNNIKNWRIENPKVSKELLDKLTQVELDIRKEQQELAQKVPDIETLDKNQKEVKLISDALKSYVTTRINFEKNLPNDEKALKETYKKFYDKLKELEREIMDWRTAHPLASKEELEILEMNQKVLELELERLDDDIPLSDRVDNYDVQKYKNEFEDYIEEKNKFIKEQYGNLKTDQISDTLISYYNKLDDIVSSIRTWKKENPDATEHDLEVLEILGNKIRAEYKVIEKLIPNEEKDRLYEGKGYSPEELENLAEHTKLPDISNSIKNLIKTPSYDKIMKVYNEYGKIPADEIETKRLKLIEMTKHIESWENDSNILHKATKELEKGNVLKLKKDAFAFARNLGAFGVQRDSFLEIKDKHRQFSTETIKYNSYESLEENKENSIKIEELEDAIEILIDELEDMIQEWQKLHNNLSGFGTKEKNKYVEAVRADIHKFAKNKGLHHSNPNDIVKDKRNYNTKDQHYYDTKKLMTAYKKKKSWKNSSSQHSEIEYIKLKIAAFEFHASISIEDKKGLLVQRKEEVEGYKKELEKALEEVQKTKAMEDKIILLKELKAKIVEAEKNLENFEKKVVTSKKDLDKENDEDKKQKIKDEVGLYEKAIAEANQGLEKLYLEWAKLYGEVDIKTKKSYEPSNTKFTNKKSEYEEKKKNFDQNKKIEDKDKLFNEINEIYKKAEFKYEFNLKEDIVKERLEKIKGLERKIKDWDNIVVLAINDDMAQKYTNQLKELSLVQKALANETQKFHYGKPVKEDALFANIKLQYEKIVKEEPNAKFVAASQRFSSTVEMWKKKNPNPKAVECMENYGKLEKMLEEINKKKHQSDTAVFFIQKDFNEVVVRMERYLDSIKNDKLEISENLIKEQKNELAEKIKGPKADLEQAVKDKDIEKATRALKQAEYIDITIGGIVRDLLIKNNLENRKKEQLELSAFDGVDTYGEFEDMKGSISKEDKAKMQKAIDAALERAKKIQEIGGSLDDAKRMLEHIPVAFWPDKFIESMRLWQQAEEAFYGNIIDEVYTTKDIAASTQDTVTQGFKAATAFKDMMESGKMEIETSDGKGTITLNLFAKGSKAVKKGDDSKDTKENEDAKIMSDVASSIGILENFIGYGDDIKNIYTAEGAAERAKEIWHFIINSTDRIINDSKSILDSSLVGDAADAAKVDAGVKIASAVLGSAAILVKLIKDGEALAKNGVSIKDALLQQDFEGTVFKVAETLLSVGASVVSITKMVAGVVKIGLELSGASITAVSTVSGVAGVVGGAISVASDVLELTKLGIKTVKDVAEKIQLVNLQQLANEQDSVMKHALHREVRSMNIKIAQDVVKMGGKTVEITGGVVSTAGSIVSLVPDPYGACVIAGTTLAFSGTGIKIAGKALTFLGQTIISVVEEKDRMKVEKLLTLAKKGDRNARLEVLRNSRKYAKMFFSVGLMQDPPEPIALEYCLQHGITEKDLNNETTALTILEKLMGNAGESMNEASILTKISNTATGLKNNVSGYLNTFKTREIQAISMNKNALKSDVNAIYLDYKKLHKKSIIYAFLTGLSPLSALAALKLDKEAQKLKEHLVDVKRSLSDGVILIKAHIEKLEKEMIDINKQKDLTDELFDKCLNLEREIEENEAFVIVINQSLDLLLEIKAA